MFYDTDNYRTIEYMSLLYVYGICICWWGNISSRNRWEIQFLMTLNLESFRNFTNRLTKSVIVIYTVQIQMLFCQSVILQIHWSGIILLLYFILKMERFGHFGKFDWISFSFVKNVYGFQRKRLKSQNNRFRISR